MAIMFLNKEELLSVYVWEITEDDDTLLAKANLDLDEIDRFNSFRADSRKRQWLAVRALINKVFDKKVVVRYHEDGRPYLAKGLGAISISHTDTYVAVLVGEKKDIGVDVESITRNYVKVKSRFITNEEMAVFEAKGFSERVYLPLTWSAKEAAFKAAHQCELDFVRDITVVGVTTDERFAVGDIEVSLNPYNRRGKFKYYVFNNHVIIWGGYADSK